MRGAAWCCVVLRGAAWCCVALRCVLRDQRCIPGVILIGAKGSNSDTFMVGSEMGAREKPSEISFKVVYWTREMSKEKRPGRGGRGRRGGGDSW